MTTAFPYDPTGSNPENHIQKNEEYDTSIFYNKWRCIIPISAPFYRKDLIVKHKETNRELLEGVDYYLGHRYQDATTVNKQMIFGSIFLTDTSLAGTVIFSSYRTLGGKSNVTQNKILEYLSTDFDDPRNCLWEEVLKRNVQLPPLHVPGSLEDAIKTDLVTGALNDIDKAIISSVGQMDTAYGNLIAKINTLELKIHEWKIPTHSADHVNPHNDTCSNVGALRLTDDAKNALKVYGKTLEELTNIINSMAVTQAELDSYALKAGFTMHGNIVLNDNNVSIMSQDGSTVINMANGDITLNINHDFQIDGNNSDQDEIAVAIGSGNNLLTIHPKNKNLVYNGYVVITSSMLNNYVPEVDVSKLVVRHVNSFNTALKGDGINSPIIADVEFKTHNNKTLIALTDNEFSNSNSLGVSSKITHKLSSTIQSAISNNRKVNGHLLSTSPKLSKQDLGLSNVANCSDLNLPTSDLFNTTVSNKAVIGHTHDLLSFGDIEHATDHKVGSFKLSEDSSFTVTDCAAKAALANDIISNRVISAENIKNAIPAVALGLIHWGEVGNNTTTVTFNKANKTLSIPPRIYYLNSTNNIAKATTLTLSHDKTYVYVTYDNIDKKVKYILESSKISDDDTRTFIGECSINTGIVAGSFATVTRITNYNDFDDHLIDKEAHGYGAINKSDFGLEKVANEYRFPSITGWGSKPWVYGLFDEGDSRLAGCHRIGGTRGGTGSYMHRIAFVALSNQITVYSRCDDFLKGFINGREVITHAASTGINTVFTDVVNVVKGELVTLHLLTFSPTGDWFSTYKVLNGNLEYKSSANWDVRMMSGSGWGNYADNFDIFLDKNQQDKYASASLVRFYQRGRTVHDFDKHRRIAISGNISVGEKLPKLPGTPMEDCDIFLSLARFNANSAPARIELYYDNNYTVQSRGLTNSPWPTVVNFMIVRKK